MLILILAATLIGARRLVRPIKILTRSAEEIAEGNMIVPIQISRGGEVGVLGKSLEQMRLRLKESIDEIRGWNVELERRVKERTKELEETMEEVTRLETVRQTDRLKSEFMSSISQNLGPPWASSSAMLPLCSVLMYATAKKQSKSSYRLSRRKVKGCRSW